MSRSRRLGNTSFFIVKCHSWQRHHNVPNTKLVLDGDDAELADVVDVANLMVFFYVVHAVGNIEDNDDFKTEV